MRSVTTIPDFENGPPLATVAGELARKGVPITSTTAEQAEKLLTRLTCWASHLEVMSARQDIDRVPWLAMYTAEVIGDLDFDVHFATAVYVMAILALDDLMDGELGQLDAAESADLADRCVHALGATAEIAPEPGGGTFVDQTVEAFAQCGQFVRQAQQKVLGVRDDAAYALFVEASSSSIACYAQESFWRCGTQSRPDLPEYTLCGKTSIFVYAYIAGVLAMTGPTDLSDAQRTQVEETSLRGGLAVRLYNDLRTAERERQLGQPNSVLLLEELAGVAPEEARAMVEAWAKRALADFLDRVETLPQVLGPVIGVIRSCVLFMCQWYTQGNLEDLSEQELRSFTASSAEVG
jgi:Terpene synthase family 2, C-terminal metal binding